MRRLRLEPPDEETVERIVEIARRNRRSWPSRRGWGLSPRRGPYHTTPGVHQTGASSQYILRQAGTGSGRGWPHDIS